MKRSLALLLFVAACATTAQVTPAQRAAGCWIDRPDGGPVTTMRWLPDAERPGALHGAKLVYADDTASANEAYILEERAGAWTMCQLEPAGERCWLVAQGESGSLEGGRAFIDLLGSRLRVSVMDVVGGERVVFQGDRDGCD